MAARRRFRQLTGVNHVPSTQIIPAARGYDHIVLNSCITSEIVGEISRLVYKAAGVGVNICYRESS
jgi:hypothetical protein